MLLNTRQHFARKKNGIRSWLPNTNSLLNGTPSSTFSANEALALFYRPLPLDDTVEYEYHSTKSSGIQRECYPRRFRRDLASFQDIPLAYSELELERGRKSIASSMKHNAPAESDLGGTVRRVIDYDQETGALQGVRCEFDDRRLQYCERFSRAMHALSGAPGSSAGLCTEEQLKEIMLQNPFKSLMEICAILHGSQSEEDQEQFLARYQLSKGDIDLAIEKRTAEIDSAGRIVEAYNAALKLRKMRAAGQALHTEVEGTTELSTDTLALSGNVELALDPVPLTEENADLLPTIASYLQHVSRGDPPPPSDPAVLLERERCEERIRWHTLLKTLIKEDYHQLDYKSCEKTLYELNAFFFRYKMFDARVGESVKEIVERQYQGLSGGTSHRDEPLDSRKENPEARRVPQDRNME